MKNGSFLKSMRGLSIGLILAASVALPVCAADGTETAGSSMKDPRESTTTEAAQERQADPYGIQTMALAGSWRQNSTGWWYEYSDGSWPKKSWRRIDEKWYYFDENGYWVDNNTCEAGTLKGIDVSKWDEEIDWQAVKADGIQFAFVRLGHGSQNLDPYYKQNMKKARAAGIPTGVYYYSTAQDVIRAKIDAHFVIDNMRGDLVSYPVVIDLEDATQEDLSKTELANIARAFCDEIRAAGYTPMLYVNEDWYQNHIDVSLLGDVELWVAAWRNTYDTTIPRDIWQCCSTGKVDGIHTDTDINFAYTDYTQIVTPRTEPQESYQPAKGAWRQNQYGYWFEYFTGGYAANTWELIDEKWYWFDANGYMVTGWVQVDGAWQYLSVNGIEANTWIKDKGVWYYVDADGHMVTGWLKLGGHWYYLNSSGVMQTGWQLINGSWYYLNAGGTMATGWLKLGSTWYYLNENGVMATGWKQVNGAWYYLNASGAMQTGWKQIGGSWYYLNANGKMATGWLKLGNTWYYLRANGVMATGWLNIGDTWYYLDGSGAMVTGWQQIGNNWFYLEASGAMATNTWIGDNYVGPNGNWIHLDDSESVYRIDTGNNTSALVIGAYDSGRANELYDQLNAYRASQGVPKLQKAGSNLQAAADLRVCELNVLFDHKRPNGTTCFTVYENSYAENIARGYGSAQAVMEAWKSSEGHKENLLSTVPTSVGISAFRAQDGTYYYVQLFAKE